MSYYSTNTHDDFEENWCVTPPVSPRDESYSDICECIYTDNQNDDTATNKIQHNTLQYSWMNTKHNNTILSFMKYKTYTEWMNYMLSR